ncbi:hypothetical protein EXT46_04690 [Pseudoalteromonas sp. CO325X]|uniref:hypothetical protein n=1 Tax=Pseudoalteromonas sp. CO325X TaxID=1777262 RepID=UPI0010233D28|nr:hypothetical protein [Pseudoalteromonas sp. CO325X]RZF83985.1 hypothetical protein EXT46_04690 [Pseudoalteromonas sp. CO325X]|tara:strand:+ start:2384 stop:2956 length:573 start_codon:yes stop_codon:yes gene_type:complete
MRNFILFIFCVAITGCASTDNGVSFSGGSYEYIEPTGPNIAYLHLETEQKTDGFGFAPYPHTAIIYEQCTGEGEDISFGYVGDVKVSTELKLGNPATVKVKSNKPIFLAFGLIHPVNGYECTSKYIFTPESDKTYSFINSVSWSACPTKTGVILNQDQTEPIEGLQTLDKATHMQLTLKGVNTNRTRCKT